jgi:hypothetical protein
MRFISTLIALLIPGIVMAETFPITVWLQSPRNAQQYKDIGITHYVGLWKGPTEEKLAELEKVGMPVYCDQNEFALKHLDRKIIAGWLHDDEPDNAQPLPDGQKGWGPPVAPEKVLEHYRQLKENDPSRPVLLNLGQGVAWDGWIGRGVRTNKPEDYPLYAQAADILSFDIYPASHNHKDVAGNLWYVARGVERLKKWASREDQIIWNCIETTRISNPDVKPTPHQVKAEVWMGIIHGSRGIIYFCHEFKPNFIEAGLLADKEMAAAVKEINAQVQSLADVIFSAPPRMPVTVESSNAEVPIAISTHLHDGAVYIFAVSMRDGETTGTFSLPALAPDTKIEVLNESRTLVPAGNTFQDTFAPYTVHLYKIPAAQ